MRRVGRKWLGWIELRAFRSFRFVWAFASQSLWALHRFGVFGRLALAAAVVRTLDVSQDHGEECLGITGFDGANSLKKTLSFRKSCRILDTSTLPVIVAFREILFLMAGSLAAFFRITAFRRSCNSS
jgi:hypothetical protein